MLLLLLLLSGLPRFAAASSASRSSTAPTASLSRAVLSVDLLIKGGQGQSIVVHKKERQGQDRENF